MSIGKGVRVAWQCNTAHSHSMELVNTKYLTLGSLENVAQLSTIVPARGGVVADLD